MDMNDKAHEQRHGLTTKEALQKLHEAVNTFLSEHETRFNKSRWHLFVSFMTGKSSCYTLISFACVSIMAVLLLFCAIMMEEDRLASGSRTWLALEVVFLIGTVAVNCVLIGFRISKYKSKHIKLGQRILKMIRESSHDNWWRRENYPNLHLPLSPCISLQWCVRDGEVLNVPNSLLVEGDTIVMRPGHAAPGLCEALEGEKTLQHGDHLSSDLPNSKDEGREGPQPRKPLGTKMFLLKETPIISNLRYLLEEKTSKPLSFIENERYRACNFWLERRILPGSLVLLCLINILRYVYLEVEATHWTELLFVIQIHGILPLVPLLLPLLWTMVNTFGQAHIFAVYNITRSMHDMRESTESLGSYSSILVEEAHVSITWKETLKGFCAMMTGRQPMPCPDFEMLHTLGSVTALCCVDKKGILSWPNPSAEKVFFFSSARKSKAVEEDEDIHPLDDSLMKEKARKRKRSKSQPDTDAVSNIEVLDLTHDTAKDAFGVLFDDPHWKNHINALKPLGLGILLNTCNEQTSSWYSQFTDHVSCAARENKDTVAVVNRRCMCLLSREIGFTDDAVNVFSHEATLGVYRQVPAEESEREKQNRARSFIQHKIPMPNEVSVVVRDKYSGMCQLMTQGTGDIVLDCCSDAWTGTDLQALSEIDRKKVLDFYHRNSMVAYCTAFAYKPLPKEIEGLSSDVYTELMESPNTTKVVHGEDVGVFLDGDSHDIPRKQRCHSVDSLLELSPNSSLESVGVGQMIQSHQTFIGMVSLQYQARQDFIQLIDKLESAYIRFVHFSKENEVRSRVFSEKMGLEAGWNCHVSLMATEAVSSDTSSCRNLSSVGNIHQSGSGNTCAASSLDGGDGPALTGGITTSAIQNVRQSRDTTPVPLGPSSNVPRTLSAPSFVNTEEIQVKFAKDPLPIVIDQDAYDEDTSENNHRAVISAHCASVNCDENTETISLLPKTEKKNEGSEEAVGELTRCNREENIIEEEETREEEEVKKKLMPQKSGGELEWEEDEEDEEEFDVQSDSRYTSSYVTENTEDSLTGVLDNRRKNYTEMNVTAQVGHWRSEFTAEAHLPRGIKNIRPHLKHIDNVPLLVNLFTDCTQEATCEMVRIMQEYGEVVMVVGSSLNVENTPVFVQADCSIAIEPLYPQLCAQHPAVTPVWNEDKPTPTELASRIISLPCPFFFQREDNIKLFQLIMESRHYVFALRNCFYLMLCCLLAVMLAQLLGCVLLLPPVMSAQHVLWLVVVVVPLLSMSLMINPNEPRTMNMATHKNINHVTNQMVLEFLVQFSTRFIPSIIVALVSFALVLHSFCEYSPVSGCTLYRLSSSRLVSNTSEAMNATFTATWTNRFQGGLVLAQNIFHMYIGMFLVSISVSLVHWQDHLWQRCPFKNWAWSAVAGSLLIVQAIFSVLDTYIRSGWFGSDLPLSQVHPAVWVLGSVWPFLTIALNELAKKREIKLAVRRQRRARLDFSTKLGMNSPF